MRLTRIAVASLLVLHRCWRGRDGLVLGDIKLAAVCGAELDLATVIAVMELAALLGIGAYTQAATRHRIPSVRPVPDPDDLVGSLARLGVRKFSSGLRIRQFVQRELLSVRLGGQGPALKYGSAAVTAPHCGTWLRSACPPSRSAPSRITKPPAARERRGSSSSLRSTAILSWPSRHARN